MRTYKPKRLVDGFKLGCDGCLGKSFVGVPRYDGQYVEVSYGGSLRAFAGSPVVTTGPYPDKYGRGDYYISYFQWIG